MRCPFCCNPQVNISISDSFSFCQAHVYLQSPLLALQPTDGQQLQRRRHVLLLDVEQCCPVLQPMDQQRPPAPRVRGRCASGRGACACLAQSGTLTLAQPSSPSHTSARYVCCMAVCSQSCNSSHLVLPSSHLRQAAAHCIVTASVQGKLWELQMLLPPSAVRMSLDCHLRSSCSP